MPQDPIHASSSIDKNIGLVIEFIEFWNKSDLDAIVRAFADDAEYCNVPMEPVKGKAAIAAEIGRLLSGMSEIRWTILSIAQSHTGAVLTERVDEFIMNGIPVVVPVMGIFEFSREGITRWSDYCDFDNYRRQLAAGKA